MYYKSNQVYLPAPEEIRREMARLRKAKRRRGEHMTRRRIGGARDYICERGIDGRLVIVEKG